MLLEYFGQLRAPNCRECDICKEKSDGLETNMYKNIKSEVKEILAKDESSVDELVELSQFSEKKLLEVIRLMMDNDEVKTTENNKIRLA